LIKALDGLRVLDLCRSYPPAFNTMIMADFGADVIKIDPIGFAPPLPIPITEDEFATYYHFDRNKRSIKLNLRSQIGKDIFYKLCEDADILIENSRPGTMERLRIDYNTLKQRNRKLIYCSVSGYGQDGPYSNRVGHDANYLGIAGVLSMIGPKDGPPCMPSNIIADTAGSGLHPLIGILIALRARDRTGKGQYIDISYTDSAFSMLGFDIAMYLCTGEKRRRGYTYQTGSEPTANIYKTKDGEYIAIQFVESQFWANFCQHVGRPELVNYLWAKDEKRVKELYEFLRQLFLTKTKEEWWEWSKDKQVMLAPVNYIEEALDDPQLKHRKMVIETEHPKFGKIIQIGNPFKLSDTPPRTKGLSPKFGEHTRQVLRELGYSDQQITSFRNDGVIE
jgi:alpha-methylacyl-CoA racemase